MLDVDHAEFDDAFGGRTPLVGTRTRTVSASWCVLPQCSHPRVVGILLSNGRTTFALNGRCRFVFLIMFIFPFLPSDLHPLLFLCRNFTFRPSCTSTTKTTSSTTRHFPNHFSFCIVSPLPAWFYHRRWSIGKACVGFMNAVHHYVVINFGRPSKLRTTRLYRELSSHLNCKCSLIFSGEISAKWLL